MLLTVRFNALTTTFFERVEVAVAPLQPPMNEDFALERDASAFTSCLFRLEPLAL